MNSFNKEYNDFYIECNKHPNWHYYSSTLSPDGSNLLFHFWDVSFSAKLKNPWLTLTMIFDRNPTLHLAKVKYEKTYK